jgi:HSP20 family protein
MNDKWRNKRKRPEFDILEAFSEIENFMLEMIKKSELEPEVNHYIYVFSIKEKPCKKANQQFEKLNRIYIPEDREQQEPLVDIFDREKEVLVVTELPNIKKEDIELYEKDNILTITVDKLQKQYFKAIELPTKVDIKNAPDQLQE